MAIGSLTIRDYSNEITTTGFNLVAGRTPANIDTGAGNLFSANVILGLPIRTSVTNKEPSAVAGPMSTSAQRELKWLVTYEDTTAFLDAPTNTVANPGLGKIFSLELGTANPALLPSGTDILTPGSAGYNAIETFVTDNVVSPYGGAPSVQSVRLVGRSI